MRVIFYYYYYHYHYFIPCEFFTPVLVGDHSGCLNDCKSPESSWFLLCILADFNTAMVYMVSIFELISNYSGLFSMSLGTVPSTLVTFGIITNLKFLFSSKVQVFVDLFAFFHFHSVVRWGKKKPLDDRVFFVCLLFFLLKLSFVFRPEISDPFVKILENFMRLIF